MENIKMKTKKIEYMSIHQKLHAACLSAKSVTKGEKKQGMHFNPLLHDAVQEEATQALLDHRLITTCDYKTEVHNNFVMITCTMTVHDIDGSEKIVIDGCSAMGGLDKFGTGQAMSYSRKYAFLNLLSLKTGIQDDDGYTAKSFDKEIPQKTSGTNHVNKKVDVEKIKSDLKNAQHLPRLNYLVQTVHKNSIDFLLKNSLRDYRQIDDIAKTREHQLTQQGAM
jgi:hypothetical protein